MVARFHSSGRLLLACLILAVPLSFGPLARPAEASASWVRLGPLPHMLDRPAVAAGHDGNIYVFGGMDNANGYTVFNSTYIYHPQRHIWTRGADMAMAREGAQAVTLPDGRIAVLGGSPSCPNPASAQMCVATPRVDVYTPRTNRWQTLPPMQHPRYRFNAVWFRGHVYAIGGLNGTQPLASVEAYDPATHRWKSLADAPQPVEGAAAAVDPWGRLYLLGGAPGSLPIYNTLFIFDGQRWTRGPAMPQATQDYAATDGPDGQIYALGGWNQTDLTAVQVYNPLARRWSLGPALPAPLCCMGAVTTPDGSIYAVGGDAVHPHLYVYRPTVQGQQV